MLVIEICFDSHITHHTNAATMEGTEESKHFGKDAMFTFMLEQSHAYGVNKS